MDLASLDKWDDYTRAKEEQFRYTDTEESPWITIKSNDKKRALRALFEFDDALDVGALDEKGGIIHGIRTYGRAPGACP